MSTKIIDVDGLDVEVNAEAFSVDPEGTREHVRVARAAQSLTADDEAKLNDVDESAQESNEDLPEDHWDDEDDDESLVEIGPKPSLLRGLVKP